MQCDRAHDPVAGGGDQEIMPDCCTLEYERVLAEFGALLPYRRKRCRDPTLARWSAGMMEAV